MNDVLSVTFRVLAGRDAMPTTRAIGTQSATTTGSGGPCGFDTGRKKSRKWHIITDTDGNLPDLEKRNRWRENVEV
ncbi:MAG: hypothetical protein GDA53_08140 [Rhodobacteraceae bacterium]|nr:hypothetical protein [Paracoccaceae bacterium]